MTNIIDDGKLLGLLSGGITDCGILGVKKDMAASNRKDLVLNDPRQADEVMVELLFELACTQNALKDLLVRFLAKGDVAVEEQISTMYSEQWVAFREVYLSELADRFDIQDQV